MKVRKEVTRELMLLSGHVEYLQKKGMLMSEILWVLDKLSLNLRKENSVVVYAEAEKFKLKLTKHGHTQ